MKTIDETGIFNNYAAEPAIYFAKSPTVEDQRRYAFQGAVATLFVGLVLLTAFSVS